ncbi:MAG TPA: HAMP domain-containing sensor histidine kinase [Thermoanaerobaculia bacterium]|nr:HAMP domain-containing sensor histidine kinase [Thermoanaerobaculia bacterium]
MEPTLPPAPPAAPLLTVAEETAGIAFLCDGAGNVQNVLRDSLGMSGRITPGQPFREVVDPDCAAKAQAFLETLQIQQAIFNWELNVPLGKDGRVAPLHFAGAVTGGGFLVVGAKSRSGIARFYDELVRINNEQTNTLRSVMKDLSLQVRAQAERDNVHYDELSRLNNELATSQRELARRNAELARLNEQKNQFLGIAAHDLRNPLEVILTYSQFLLDDASGRLEPEQVKFVETIRSSSDFMLSLVENLLDLAKIEAGRLDLDLISVDLAEVLERNVALNRILAQKKDIDVVLRCDPGLPSMRIDVPKIEQVLNNLIGNAVKFSPPGSLVEVRAEEKGDCVILAVHDQGPGVPADELDKLFRPFGRTRVRPSGGERCTGLGLAIVKKVVEGHGGEIRVESAPGEGATFFVSLPRKAALKN